MPASSEHPSIMVNSSSTRTENDYQFVVMTMAGSRFDNYMYSYILLALVWLMLFFPSVLVSDINKTVIIGIQSEKLTLE